MIDVLLKTYLENELGIPVIFEKPKDVPESYVLIELTDEGKENHINSATFQFHCNSNSLYNSAVLTESVQELLENATTLPAISKSQIGGKSAYISVDKRYKYILTYNFTYYREET